MDSYRSQGEDPIYSGGTLNEVTVTAKRNVFLDQLGGRVATSGIFGNLSYLWSGGIENGAIYDRNGYPFMYAPQMGAPDFIGGPAKGLKWLNKYNDAEKSVQQIGKYWKYSSKVMASKGDGSYTVFNKFLNTEGKTIKWYHDTFDNTGRFLHRGWTQGSTKIHQWWDGYTKIGGGGAGPHVPR